MAVHTKTGTTTPIGNVTPDAIGQHFLDTVTGTFYQADGTTNTDWISLGGGS